MFKTELVNEVAKDAIKKNIFEIVKNGMRVDGLGEATQGDGARFYTLTGIDKWLSTMKFEFSGNLERTSGEDCLEWQDNFDIEAVEFSGVGFEKWYWRHTKNGWACKVYEGKNGWVLNKDLKGRAE